MSQVKRVPLTCPEVSGLVCKFTGKPIRVVASISEGTVTYSSPGAFTLRKPVKSVEELYRRASMRRGIYGVVSRNESLTDPYTGDTFSLVNEDGLFWFEGGFDPTCPCLSIAEFVKKASGGERTLEEPPKAESVEHVGDMTPNDDDSAHKAVDDLTEEAAKKIVDVIPGANMGRVVVGFREPQKKGVKH